MIKHDQYSKLSDNLREVTECISNLKLATQDIILKFFKEKLEVQQKIKRDKENAKKERLPSINNGF